MRKWGGGGERRGGPPAVRRRGRQTWLNPAPPPPPASRFGFDGFDYGRFLEPHTADRASARPWGGELLGEEGGGDRCYVWQGGGNAGRLGEAGEGARRRPRRVPRRLTVHLNSK